MACDDWAHTSNEFCSAEVARTVLSTSATGEPEFGTQRDEVPGERASKAADVASPVLCSRANSAVMNKSRGFGLSLEFEKDGLGSSLGAGEGRTFAGVLQVRFVSVTYHCGYKVVENLLAGAMAQRSQCALPMQSASQAGTRKYGMAYVGVG